MGYEPIWVAWPWFFIRLIWTWIRNGEEQSSRASKDWNLTGWADLQNLLRLHIFFIPLKDWWAIWLWHEWSWIAWRGCFQRSISPGECKIWSNLNVRCDHSNSGIQPSRYSDSHRCLRRGARAGDRWRWKGPKKHAVVVGSIQEWTTWLGRGKHEVESKTCADLIIWNYQQDCMRKRPFSCSNRRCLKCDHSFTKLLCCKWNIEQLLVNSWILDMKWLEQQSLCSKPKLIPSQAFRIQFSFNLNYIQI